MNILFCYKNWLNPNKGGVGRVADTLACYFQGEGHNMYYLNHEFDVNDSYVFPAKIYTLPDADFFSKVNLNYYHDLLNKLSIDVVVNHDSSNDRSRFWLNTGKYLVAKISYHHIDPLHGLNRTQKSGILLNRYLYWIQRLVKVFRYRRELLFLLNNSDKLLLLSNEFKYNISKELRIESSKIEAISNPCVIYHNTKTYCKKKQILFVARIELSQKRPDILLQIWSRLHKKFTDWELLILGDGPDRQKVECMAKELNLYNISFKGFVDPIPYYKEASIICMTSDYEGFGLVLPEAMQFGVVPIAFNNWPSLKDIIIDKKTGVIVESNNITEYADKLDQLMSDEEMRHKFSEAAIKDVNKFNIEIIGPKWIELLESCKHKD
jgi:glycosyltransferase involved in cell wall biosynthesis